MLDLKPAIVNFTLCENTAIYKDSDWNIPISIWDRDEYGNESKVNLTGFTGEGIIKVDATSEEEIADIDVTISNENVINLSLDSSVTKEIPTTGKKHYDTTKYQYDVYISKGDERYRVLNGFVEVSPNIEEE